MRRLGWEGRLGGRGRMIMRRGSVRTRELEGEGEMCRGGEGYIIERGRREKCGGGQGAEMGAGEREGGQ